MLPPLWTEGTRCASAPAALLFIALLTGTLVAAADAAALNGSNKGDSVRVTAEQMQQLKVIDVELYPFRVQKGQEADSTQRIGPHAGVAVDMLDQLMRDIIAAGLAAQHRDVVPTGPPARTRPDSVCVRD
jgi:hypothetical protein